jgi:thioredoxin-like negative regulator of GroEL
MMRSSVFSGWSDMGADLITSWYQADMRRLALLLLVACKSHEEPPKQAPAPAPAGDPCAKAKPEGQMSWIADDYPAALACAKQKKVPLVIDLWAPWCHTCLSMQSTVFTDPSFQTERDKFVWLAMDTDKEQNAPALTKLSISAWPTFYVLGNDEAVLARFVGAASVQQFHDFLSAGAKAQAGGIAAADARFLGAERALAIKDYDAADSELAAALTSAPKDWPQRPEVLNQMILTKLKKNDTAGCLAVADEHMDETGNAAAASDFLVTAMTCAEQRAKDDPDRVKAIRERAVTRWQALLADKSAQLSVDDRSDAMASLREALDALGKTDQAKQTAEAQRALLDDAAAKAPTPMAAMTYNWPRAEVYVYLGKPLDLVPALEKSAKDLPAEYDPRARLGWIYLKANKLPEAAKWTDEALTMVYGPRKGRILTQRADIAAAAGDKTAERGFRQAAVKLYEGLPAGQQSPDALAKAQQALASVGSAAP